MKAFYIGNTATIVAKAEDYMTKTDAYQEIINGHSPLADNLHPVQTILDYVMKTKAHFHGLPKIHKEGIPLRPIIACIHALATLMSELLKHLLAPIYLQVACETTFISDIDVVQKFEKYVANGYLKSITKFITADVENLYTMIPRESAIQALA